MENSKYKELFEIKRIVESQEFQKYILKPMKDYRFAQKNNFFSDSVKDQWRKGGRVEGVNELLKILKTIDNDFKNERYDVETSS